MAKAKPNQTIAKNSLLRPASKIISLPKRKSKKLRPHTRVLGSLLSPYERPVLLWLAARMPAWVSPDILTGLGVFGGLLIFAGFYLSNFNIYYLTLASFGFFLNWFGDSLDGTIARYRKIERPKYGFFIDHSVDGFLTVCIFLGAGLSPFVDIGIAMFALISYMLLSIHVYIMTYVTGEFKISYAKLGPTEARLLAITTNTVVMFFALPVVTVFGWTLSFYDIVGLFIGTVASGSYFYSTIKKGIMLSRADRESQKN